MPSLGDQVRDWQRGVEAVERGDWSCALRLFSGFPEPPAKMCFNVGCVHLLAGDPEAALRAFDQAVTKDACLAVGFFQRGVARLQVGRSQEALADFQQALAQLRGNAAIDYTQLGLRFKLQAWEVRFNMATAQCALGLWTVAQYECKVATNQFDVLVNGSRILQPRRVPRGEVFRPPRRHLEHLDRVDFLGKAKVVVASPALEARNQGVWPQQPQVRGEDGGARPQAGPRALDTGACRADTPLGPRTPSHADLEAGSDQARRAGPCAPGTSEGQCAFTLALQAPRGADLSHLRALLGQALPLQAQRGQLRWPAGLSWAVPRLGLREGPREDQGGTREDQGGSPAQH
ncbi:PREDICTED: NADPH oxidase activator 1 [Myotis davidii]|uniref:NADPH oxidase activator 1 n=1 Tax=Myotis davidii TaxID=225400 RepID=UPI0007677920|nr:PREDICTED: NADPH oxidase activator 1 [Myotis davidii]